MPIKTSSAKAKGRNLQKWVRDRILETYPALEPDDVKSTSMGAGGEDVQLSPAARRNFPYSVECKARSSFATYGIMDQAKTNAPKGMEPIAVIKADRKEPLLIVKAQYFFDLLKGRHE